jgi:hypothetical protein
VWKNNAWTIVLFCFQSLLIKHFFLFNFININIMYCWTLCCHLAVFLPHIIVQFPDVVFNSNLQLSLKFWSLDRDFNYSTRFTEWVDIFKVSARHRCVVVVRSGYYELYQITIFPS